MNGEPTLFDMLDHVQGWIGAKLKENIPLANKIDQYHNVIKPTLTQREHEVYEAVKVIQPCTMHEVAEYMERPLNTISGRFSKLVEKEFLAVKERVNHKSIFIINKTYN